MKSNIILIGFMGSGKSSIGKTLCQLTEKNFIDMDEIVQSNVGMSIQQIFLKHGESYFRAKERELVNELESQSNLVIATGGGIVLDQRNMDLLSKHGIIVYLKCKLHTIVQRIKSNHSRPLFNPKNLHNFEQIFTSRVLLYEENANITVDVNDISINQSAAEILEIVKKMDL